MIFLGGYLVFYRWKFIIVPTFIVSKVLKNNYFLEGDTTNQNALSV